MKALVACHILVYCVCLGLIGLRISLATVSTPPVVVALDEPRTFPRHAEIAYLEGLASYQSAVTRERLGDRSGFVTVRLQHAQRLVKRAINFGLPPQLLPEAYFTLGDSYLHGDADPIPAERALRRCLDLNPSHFAAACSLARSYSLMGLAMHEAGAWERALALRPDTAAVHRDAALAYFRSSMPNRLERAYDHAIAAIQIDESLESVLAHVLEAGEASAASDDAFQDSPDRSLRDGGDAGRASDSYLGAGPALSDAEADRYAQEIGKLLGQK